MYQQETGLSLASALVVEARFITLKNLVKVQSPTCHSIYEARMAPVNTSCVSRTDSCAKQMTESLGGAFTRGDFSKHV